MPLIKNIVDFAGGLLLIAISMFLLFSAWTLVDQGWFLYIQSAFCLFMVFVGAGGIRLSMRCDDEKVYGDLPPGDYGGMYVNPPAESPNPLSKKEVK